MIRLFICLFSSWKEVNSIIYFTEITRPKFVMITNWTIPVVISLIKLIGAYHVVAEVVGSEKKRFEIERESEYCKHILLKRSIS